MLWRPEVRCSAIGLEANTCLKKVINFLTKIFMRQLLISLNIDILIFNLACESSKSESEWKSYGCLKLTWLSSPGTLNGPMERTGWSYEESQDGLVNIIEQSNDLFVWAVSPLRTLNLDSTICTTFQTSWDSMEFVWTPNWVQFLLCIRIFDAKLSNEVSS